MYFDLSSSVKSLVIDDGGYSHKLDRSDLKISGDTISFRLEKGFLIEDIEFDELLINSVFVRYKCEYRINVIDLEVSADEIEAKTVHYKSILDLEYEDLDLKSECVERFVALDFFSERHLKDKLQRYVYNEETDQDFTEHIFI